jgi:hypothetical protein
MQTSTGRTSRWSWRCRGARGCNRPPTRWGCTTPPRSADCNAPKSTRASRSSTASEASTRPPRPARSSPSTRLAWKDELLGVQRALESREGVPRGRVRLTTVPSLVASILPALTRLSEQCPELTLELDATPDTRALERGDADLALRPTAEPPPELVGTRLTVMGWATYRRRAGRRKDERLLYAGRLAERDQSTPVAGARSAIAVTTDSAMARVHRGRPRRGAPALLRGRRAPEAHARGCRGEDVHRALALEPRGAAQERPRAGHAGPPGGVPDPRAAPLLGGVAARRGSSGMISCRARPWRSRSPAAGCSPREADRTRGSPPAAPCPGG